MNLNSLTLVRYAPADVEPLHRIVTECGVDMKNRFGLTHWYPPYPLETMRSYAREATVYGVHAGGEVIGTFTVGTHGWTFDDSLWADASHKPLYLGKLAILPQYQGQGIGGWCMRQVEALACALECQAVRFDMIAQHTTLLSFYRKLGYVERGQKVVVDWRGISWDVIYFEKIMTNSPLLKPV